jgi:glycosyltransferase involved in cell wall biosynthesis
MGRRLAVRRSRIDVVFRGRDPNELGPRTKQRRDVVRHRLGIPDGAPFVLAVGRQETQKGLDVLVAATALLRGRYRDLVVCVAGREGSATSELRQLNRQAGTEDVLAFLGARTDVPDLMVAADVLAFPSRWEGGAGTLLEALALECPIVCSDLATLVGTVDRSTAHLVPVDDAQRLADGLAAVIDAPGDAAALAAAGRRRFDQKFTIDASAAGMVSVYERALAETRWR